jgi:hypothetical protein
MEDGRRKTGDGKTVKLKNCEIVKWLQVACALSALCSLPSALCPSHSSAFLVKLLYYITVSLNLNINNMTFT